MQVQTTLATTLANNNGSSIVMGTLFNSNAAPIIINSVNVFFGDQQDHKLSSYGPSL